MKCQFEEKQYEQHLNNELLMRHNLLYIPGQVLEGHLGFDAALYSNNQLFWSLWNMDSNSTEPIGIQLYSRLWRELEPHINYFPEFRYNVFLQHKRPEYLTRSNSKEWSDWNQPYYRYSLTNHQQKALEQLEENTKTNAIVVYASPAFIELDDLWKAIGKRELIENSNFCQPKNLSGHRFYSYIEPGNMGKSHSEAKNVESFDFYERLSSFLEISEVMDDNRSFIIRIGNHVNESIEDCGTLTDSFKRILAAFNNYKEDEFYLAMARIFAFTFVVGVRWLIRVR